LKQMYSAEQRVFIYLLVLTHSTSLYYASQKKRRRFFF